jgi:formylglycine-generating enzyme required for sulfatase activity
MKRRYNFRYDGAPKKNAQSLATPGTLEGIGKALAKDKEKTPLQWYVHAQGQTMVVIPGPVEFVMGSPPTEAGRIANEAQHKKRIGRTFVLSAKSVTLGEYRKFKPRYGIGEFEQWAPSANNPVIGTNWFQAVQYCNWLRGRISGHRCR